MMKTMVRHRVVSLLSLAALAFAAGGFFWALGALGGVQGPLILHFSDFTGITATGGVFDIVLMGIIGIVIIAVDFFAALGLDERDRFLGKTVAALSLILGILLFLAFAAIIRVN